MLKDISSRNDIVILVDTFYEKVLSSDTIGHIFNDVAKINLEEHLPILYDFWGSMVFNQNMYKGNPMKVHLDLNQKVPLEKRHFDEWLKLFNETVDELFTGESASLAKTRALSMATVMQIKLSKLNSH
ncbi:MAG: group III truncated hemoglobin [Cytophagales bacterium]|nr:group III truncated hemoglobin [Cytophagales bacterium]